MDKEKMKEMFDQFAKAFEGKIMREINDLKEKIDIEDGLTKINSSLGEITKSITKAGNSGRPLDDAKLRKIQRITNSHFDSNK